MADLASAWWSYQSLYYWPSIRQTFPANLTKICREWANDYYNKISAPVEEVTESERRIKGKRTKISEAAANVQKWSNPEYRNTSSAEELEEI